MKRGQKTALDNIVPIASTASRSALTPISPLTKDERRCFDLVMRENPHLRPIDVPLVSAFSIAFVRMVKASKRQDPADWEKASRVLAMLATKLRISPQSSTDPETLARRRRDHQNCATIDAYFAELDLEHHDDEH